MSFIPSQTSTTPVSATATSDSASDSNSDSTSTWASIPPMITSWRQPDSVECHFTFDVANLASMSQSGISAWLDLQIDAAASTFSCYPPGMFENGNSGVFSPALCPMSWTTVGHLGADDESEGVTTRTCCSSGFTLDNDGDCVGAFTAVTATPASYISSLSSYSLLTESATVLPHATVAHHRILVEFEDSDKESIGLLDEDTIIEHADHDLSMTTKIGITFAALAVVCLISLVICLFMRWRKTKDDISDMERQQRQQRPLGPPPYTQFGAVVGNGYRNSGYSTTVPGTMPPPLHCVGLGKTQTVDSQFSSGDGSEKGRSQRLNSDATTVREEGVTVLVKDETTSTK